MAENDTVEWGNNQILNLGFKTTNIHHHLVSSFENHSIVKTTPSYTTFSSTTNVNHLKDCFSLSDIFFVFRLLYSQINPVK